MGIKLYYQHRLGRISEDLQHQNRVQQSHHHIIRVSVSTGSSIAGRVVGVVTRLTLQPRV